MLSLRFKSGKLLFNGSKLAANCCKWKVTGYTRVILPIGCTYGAAGCPACESTPVLTISDLYFNGSPQTVVEAAVSGFIDVNCKFDLSHNPISGDNAVFFPCVSTTVPWKDRAYYSESCINENKATVSYDFEDCPGAKNSGDGTPLLDKDLRIVFSLEAK